jgi:HD-GYP domain-containing protein (c-di-GMP phosphodiesterase class II)
MTLLPDLVGDPVPAADRAFLDAMRLLGAVGDAVSGRALGASAGVASLAARLAARHGVDAERITAAYYAGLLHGIGGVRLKSSGEGWSDRAREIARWDIPLHGAKIVANIGGLPPATADMIRWHCESWDGTGYPDRLRWHGIPSLAMIVNIAMTFIELGNDPSEPRGADEAMYEILGRSGKEFSVPLVREFRDFFMTNRESIAEIIEPPLAIDRALAHPDAAIIAVARDADKRDERSAGRGERIASFVATTAAELGWAANVRADAILAAELTAFGRLHGRGVRDEFDPLSRLGRDLRAAECRAAAAIVATAPSYARLAVPIRGSSEWFDGTGLPDRKRANDIDPIARVLALATAYESLVSGPYGLTPSNGPTAATRIVAASGTQFDPITVSAFLKAQGVSA